MAAARGGRGRGGRSGGGGGGSRGDGLSSSLRDALAQALDVDAEAVEVRVTVDGAPVDDRIVTSVVIAAAPAAASRDEPDGADEARPEDERSEEWSHGRSGRSGRSDRSGRSGRDDDGDDATTEAPTVTPEELDEEAEAAADLLEGLLDAMDLPGDLRIQVHAAHAEVEIVGVGEGVLIGRRGQTLEAVQDLVRTAMQRRFERRSRVLVDVDGYRARRLEKLMERADEAVREVLATGEPQRLEPMDAIERRLVHQRVAEHGGVVSHSHGREPARRIEIELADD